MACVRAVPFRIRKHTQRNVQKIASERRLVMDEIITEYSENILRVELNRPAKRNAMTSGMYLALAEILDAAAKDERVRVVLWHGAGDAFCAGNDLEDFLKNPPGPGESPQARLMNALIDFVKPLIAAVHGAAIGGGTTMLTHCDFVYAGESAKFQMPFINLALVPEFGSSCLVPLTIGHIRAAELILLGSHFGAARAAELGLVTQVVSDQTLLQVATETARNLATKPAGALQACKRLLKRSFREQVKAAMKAENEAFSVQVRSGDAKEAFTAFLEKRPPDFTKASKPAAAT
jgi:enoyl-CoA hydratase/carnithine racemase